MGVVDRGQALHAREEPPENGFYKPKSGRAVARHSGCIASQLFKI